MRKLSLLQKLILGILLGILIGYVVKATQIYFVVKVFSTFNSIFGNFLAFIIPLIIITFVAQAWGACQQVFLFPGLLLSQSSSVSSSCTPPATPRRCPPL